MIIDIFKERLTELQPGLRMLFQRCEITLEEGYIWISCSERYKQLIQGYQQDILAWLNKSGLNLAISGVGFAVPKNPRKLWLASSDFLHNSAT